MAIPWLQVRRAPGRKSIRKCRCTQMGHPRDLKGQKLKGSNGRHLMLRTCHRLRKIQ